MTTSLRACWDAGGTALGCWLTVPSTVSVEAVAGLGFDYVCTDLQHGAFDYASAVGAFQAI